MCIDVMVFFSFVGCRFSIFFAGNDLPKAFNRLRAEQIVRSFEVGMQVRKLDFFRRVSGTVVTVTRSKSDEQWPNFTCRARSLF